MKQCPRADPATGLRRTHPTLWLLPDHGTFLLGALSPSQAQAGWAQPPPGALPRSLEHPSLHGPGQMPFRAGRAMPVGAHSQHFGLTGNDVGI